MNTLNDQLKKWKNKNQPVPVKKKRNNAEISQQAHCEKLTDRDLKDLMGMNRQTLKRHKGSYRQR
ncbi:hypothetical protein AWM68_19780 [Fictibacillus phosphorivorans]|uniref:Phage protein n=1 Tax=Fictibacillus phosphorivorans TaxID=1221500 RepID=A0A161RSQ1_9BACL|nr:hypothetical protein [Fictibacillus phosphorivorans]KZE67033.1 hypothetical protein AWM68_19780 [Fictibacillus phosphorivorans]